MPECCVGDRFGGTGTKGGGTRGGIGGVALSSSSFGVSMSTFGSRLRTLHSALKEYLSIFVPSINSILQTVFNQRENPKIGSREG